MSRDQKPRRANNFVAAPPRSPPAGPRAAPTPADVAPAPAIPTDKTPAVVLGGLFVVASIAGGIGLTVLLR